MQCWDVFAISLPRLEISEILVEHSIEAVQPGGGMSLKNTLFAVFFCIVQFAASQVSANTTCSATVADCVPRIRTVQDVHASDLSGVSFTSFYLVSYGDASNNITPGDGAAGLFVRAPCGGNSDNGGSILQDSMNLCFYRQNLNGDLRQWGVTSGSVYDASYAYAHGTFPADVRNVITSTFWTALSAAGITSVTTSQISIFFDNATPTVLKPIDIPITSSLSCGATGGSQISGANYLGRPGTIFLRHNAYIHFPKGLDASNLHDCLILPSWLLPNNPNNLGNPTNTQAYSDCTDQSVSGWPANGVSFSYPVTSYDDLEAIRANMIICHDVAVFWDSNSGGTSHNIWAYGFDNPFNLRKADHIKLVNSAADGDVCYYSESGGGNTRIDASDCDVALTKNPLINPASTNSNCVQADSANNKVCNSEYWQIADIQPATSTNSFGRHNCRVTLVKGLATGPWMDHSNNPKAPDPNVLVKQFPVTPYSQSAPPLSNPNAAGDPITWPMWIANLDATTGAISCLGHGPHAITWIGSGPSLGGTGPYSGGPYAIVDLLESDFGMHPSGGSDDRITANATWDSCLRAPCAIRIVSGNVDAMEVGELVTGTDIPASTTVVSVVRNAKGKDLYDGYIAEIFVSKALTTAHNTGADTSIRLDSDPNGLGAYTPTNPAMASPCDDAHAGQCAFFHSGVRAFAGTSNAGTISSTLPESGSHYYAAGYLDNGTAGLDLIDAFSFSHHFGYVVQDANSTLMVDRAGDENGELDDLGEEFYVVNGTTGNTVVQGGKGGQSGVGIVNNFYTLISDSAHSTNSSTHLGQGLTTTLIANLTNFPSDLGTNTQYGKGTAGLCASTTGTTCNNGSPTEYVTYEILTTGSSGSLAITSRGDYFTTPFTTSSGYVLITPVSVSRPNNCTSISSSSAPVTNFGLNSFENIGGCLQLVNFVQPQAKNAFVGNNAAATNITNSNLPALQFLYENSTAYATMSGCGNSVVPNQAWNCHSDVPPGQTATIAFNQLLDASAEFWPCNATIGNVTVTVPLGSALPNKTFRVKKIDPSTHTCTVTMSGSDKLDGASTYVLTTGNQAVSFINASGSTTWYVTATVP